jgi:phospholipid N-methyltransferase
LRRLFVPQRPDWLFARQFLAHPRRVGAVVPASRALVARLVAGIDWAGVETAVELGPGTGVVTRAMLARLPATARLHVFEINPAFAAHLARHIGDPRLIIHTASAEHLGDRLGGQADAMISGLPLAAMAPALRHRILAAAAAALKPGALLTGYQYSPLLMGELAARFGHVGWRLEPRNWPPALVFTARAAR